MVCQNTNLDKIGSEKAKLVDKQAKIGQRLKTILAFVYFFFIIVCINVSILVPKF